VGQVTTTPSSGADDIRTAMRRDLVVALKARDTSTVTALRTAIAAVDNAEAVDTSAMPATTQDGPVAGATAGLGSSEVARRVLTAADRQSVVHALIAEYLDEADRYESRNQHESAEVLRRQAGVLHRYSNGSH
jgi:uncharacterized protein